MSRHLDHRDEPSVQEFQTVEQFPTVDDLFGALFRSTPTGWVFRGQHDFEWPLETSLERALKETPKRARLDQEQRIIGFFKDHARIHLTEVPAEEDIRGWLSLMQHYRAPTRLLDWTESPFVALFFAYENPRPPDSLDRCLWALDAARVRASIVPTVRDHLGNIPTQIMYGVGGEDPLNFEDNVLDQQFQWNDRRWEDRQNELLTNFIRGGGKHPLPLLPSRLDLRMANQQAVFTCDAALDGGIPLDLDVNGMPSVKCVALPDGWRAEVLRRLRLMGISAQMIYPGLDGLGSAVAAMLEMDWDIRAWFERGAGPTTIS